MTKHNKGKGTAFMNTPKTNYPSGESSKPTEKSKKHGFVRTNDEAMADEHNKGKSGKAHSS